MTLITPITGGPAPFDGRQRLWQGRPTWRSAVRRIWKAPIIGLYFLLLLADGSWLAAQGSHAPPDALIGEAKLLAVAVIVLGGLCLAAWLTRRTTVYTINHDGVVMRYGIALQARLDIPFGAIEHVGIRVHRDHTGDLALRLKPGQRVMYPKLWPHARPWRFFRAEPMLRCIPDAGVVGANLCRAMAAHARGRATVTEDAGPQTLRESARAAV